MTGGLLSGVHNSDRQRANDSTALFLTGNESDTDMYVAPEVGSVVEMNESELSFVTGEDATSLGLDPGVAGRANTSLELGQPPPFHADVSTRGYSPQTAPDLTQTTATDLRPRRATRAPNRYGDWIHQIWCNQE